MIELVWDGNDRGTAVAASGASIAVGAQDGVAPEDLAAAAAAGCLMRTFLALADREGLPVLSFVATARVDRGQPLPRVHVHAYVATPAGGDPRSVHRGIAEAVAVSPVCRLLGRRLVADVDVQPLYVQRAG
jgi:organic hydroperoxide reductase OsmC/OhrA